MGIAYNTRLRLLLTIYAFFCVFFLSSCTHLPRVIVLHDPLTVEEHISLGLSYELKGEYDYAIQEYSKAIKRSGSDYRPLFYMGNVYYKKKDYESAKKYYNRALRIVPFNGDIHNNLAWVYMDTENLEEARGEIARALKTKSDPYYLDTLARIYDKMGKYKDAIGVLKEAIAITPPADTDLLYNEYKLLGDLYTRLGEDELAEEATKKAEKIPLNPPLIKGD